MTQESGSNRAYLIAGYRKVIVIAGRLICPQKCGSSGSEVGVSTDYLPAA